MEHYFTKKPRATDKDFSYKVTINNKSCTFVSKPSVFSKKRIDPGSFLLLTESNTVNAKSVLDLGCGIGTIGIMLKKINPSLDLTLSDVNLRALSLAKINSKRNKIKVHIVNSELYNNIKSKFDVILCNPPQKAGRQVSLDIIKEAPKYLNKNGSLQIVARHNKGGKVLKEKMKIIFGNVITIARKSGYQVYYSILE